MKKYEYLSELEKRLSALPADARRDALNYYEEYFDAAGPDNEDATAAELGDPAEAARKILEGEGLTPDDAAPGKPPLTTPTAPEPPAADPQPAPPRRNPKAKTMWLIFAVVIVAALLIQLAVLALSFAKPSGGTASMMTVPQTEEETAASVLVRNEDFYNEATAAEESSTTENADNATVQSNTIRFERRGFKNTTFYIDYGTVTVETSDAVTLPTLSYTNIHGDWFSCYTEETTNTLRVTYTVPANYDLSNDDVPQFTLTVPSPRSFTFDALHLEVDMGDVQFHGDVEADTVDVTVNMGNFSGQAVTAKAFSANLDMGNFDLDKLNGAQTTNVSVSMGNIGLSADGSAADYDLDMTTDMGKVTFNGLEQGDGYHARSNQEHPRSLILVVDVGDAVLTTER